MIMMILKLCLFLKVTAGMSGVFQKKLNLLVGSLCCEQKYESNMSQTELFVFTLEVEE